MKWINGFRSSSGARWISCGLRCLGAMLAGIRLLAAPLAGVSSNSDSSSVAGVSPLWDSLLPEGFGTQPAADGWSTREYLKIHHQALASQAPEWATAVDRLKKSGDDFSRIVLRSIRRKSLPKEARERVDAALLALDARIGPTPGRIPREAVRPLIERASVEDILCGPLEVPLKQWVFQSLTAVADRPEIRIELAHIVTDREDSGSDPKSPKRNLIRERMSDHAGRLLLRIQPESK